VIGRCVRRATKERPKRVDSRLDQDCFIDRTRSTGEVWLAERIFNAVLEDPRTHSVGTDALVEALVSSFSFDHTRRLWSLITKVPQWRGDQLRRLDHAAKSNPQVAQANVKGMLVPELVRPLVERFEPPLPPTPEDPWATSASGDPPF
jgi:hypothetical protein